MYTDNIYEGEVHDSIIIKGDYSSDDYDDDFDKDGLSNSDEVDWSGLKQNGREFICRTYGEWRSLIENASTSGIPYALLNAKVLTILSNPWEKDSDGDGLEDKYDDEKLTPDPLSVREIVFTPLINGSQESTICVIKLYNGDFIWQHWVNSNPNVKEEYYVNDDVISQLLEYNDTVNFDFEPYYPWDYLFDSKVPEKIALRDLKRQVARQKNLLDKEFLHDFPTVKQYSDEYYGMWIRYVELRQRYDEAGLLVRDFGYLIADVVSLVPAAFELVGTIKQFTALRQTVKLVGGKQNFQNIKEVVLNYGDEAVEILQKYNITNSAQLENTIVENAVNRMGVSSKIEQSAEVANRELANLGYTDPPYKLGTKVQIVTSSEDVVLVRVKNQNNSALGKWWMREGDISGLTPMEIKNKFALPDVPTDYIKVNVPAGSTFRVGIVNPLYGNDGCGLQFEAYKVFIEENWIIEYGVLQ